MLTITLRPPRAGDGPGLARTWIDAGHTYAGRAGADVQVPETAGLAAWFERSLVAPVDDRCVLVAEHNDAVIGFVLGSLARPVPDAAKQLVKSLGQIRLVVDALAVQESYRRLGEWRSPLGLIAPTGRQFEHEGIRLFRIAAGKMVDAWGGADTLTQFQQLGLVPTEL